MGEWADPVRGVLSTFKAPLSPGTATMAAAAGTYAAGAHLRERKRKVTRSLVDGNASEGRREGEAADDLSPAMPHDDRHVRRRC